MAPSDRLVTDLGGSLLLTDLYQLNMLQAYRDAGMTATAVFEFFVRKLPPTRGFSQVRPATVEPAQPAIDTAAIYAARNQNVR